MNDEMNTWLKNKLKNAAMSGTTYYVARQKLIDKGYSAIEINAAVDDLRQSATPEDSSLIIWLSQYDKDVRSASNVAFGNSLLRNVPVAGPFYGIRSLYQSFAVASNTSGRSKRTVALIWVCVIIVAAIIAFILPVLLAPVMKLLPSVMAIPTLLLLQYGVPIILIILVLRYLFRRR